MAKKELPPLAQTIATLRRQRGYTQRQLAELSGLTVSGLTSLEQGKRIDPSWTTIQMLARALRVDTDTFRTIPLTRASAAEKTMHGS